jgi:hypothetical protein
VSPAERDITYRLYRKAIVLVRAKGEKEIAKESQVRKTTKKRGKGKGEL